MIATRMITCKDADDFGIIDEKVILNSPTTWENPYKLVQDIERFVRAQNKGVVHANAHIVQDHGMLMLVLGDNPHGIVIGYYGWTPNPHELTYLVIRTSGLSWHPPLTEQELNKAIELTNEDMAYIVATYEANMPALQYLLSHQDVLLQDVHRELTVTEKRALWALDYDLWRLHTMWLLPFEKAMTFSGIYLRFTALLESLGQTTQLIIANARRLTHEQ